ncbi:IS110 family transposase [Sinirhodobacter populi]|uniref:IS110 family transposase n=1 Tax=Paenirhodobacter populi TaxID=2306993 RepID=A0A443K461_9RHOB|nr:IS110 family transposase [Sinirhodobacter populi]RWR05931.1 IS110 family transposase [Sinirhodobacter populi]RWR27556.1 IS110 family transposase [Sinirhodobacter populi]
MDYYAGIDVSQEQSSVCVVDGSGKIVRETKVVSEPEALSRHFAELGLPIIRIGLEAGPLSQWLREGLVVTGFDVVLLETRHVRAALSAMTVKTDRKAARGIAQLLRMGWFRPVHAKSADAQATRAVLIGRKLLQAKQRDVELGIRGILRGYGLKVGEVSRGRFEARIRDLIEGHDMLATVIGAMLKARIALWGEFTRLHRTMLKIARADPVCNRLRSVPGVGALVALTYRSAVDDPGRFSRSRTVGAYFGLTPGKYQSGETDKDGGITRVGDSMVRTALYKAAYIMLTRASRFSALKGWAMGIAKRRGMKRAKVALARKLAIVLHRMWVDANAFRWSKEVAAA